METKAKKPILQTLGEGMLQMQQEIDELALQLSLGKADAKDKFEEFKSEFKSKLNGLKNLLKAAIDQSIPIGIELKVKELEFHLTSDNVISKESFETQRAALIAATIALEKEIVVVLQKAEVSEYFHHEVEKFLLKLEILRLKFGIKRFEIKDAFRIGMASAGKVIGKLSSKAKKINRTKSSQSELEEEIATAYKSLKSAVKNL